MTVLDRLPPAVAAKIQPEPMSGCWLWEGALVGGGYGNFTLAQRVYRTHVFVYESLVGPVPHGLELDHLCRTKPCCNPAHLEPVTHVENMRRHFNAAATCKNGHPWTEENTWRSPSHGRRGCRACNRENQRRLRSRREA